MSWILITTHPGLLMNKSGQILLIILVLLISALLGSWFYNNFTWVEENKEVGFQGLARSNQLLAAEFFLRKMGVNVQQVNGLSALRDLPSSNYTVLIATQRETINKELTDNLSNWLHSGGHVIVEAKFLPDFRLPDDDNKNNLESAEKLQKKLSEVNDELLKKWSLFAMQSHADEDNKNIPVRVLLDNNASKNQYSSEIEVDFPYDLTLSSPVSAPEPIWVVADNAGQYLMQFPVGRGLLTVMTSAEVFSNYHIAEHQHAQFLHYLVQMPEHDAGVWLIRVDDMPPLWQWLWENAWYAMFSLILLFLFWLWRAPYRFGPVLNDAQLQRRSLLEHIRASGYYRWHNKQSAYLLEQVQNRLWCKIQKSHPALQREGSTQTWTLLQDITGIDAALIKEALSKGDTASDAEFTRKIQLLEMIYQHL